MPKSKEFLSSSDSDSDAEQPKPKKKKKAEAKPEKDDGAKGDKKSDKAEKSSNKPTTNSSGDKMFQIAKMRYVTVSEFRGKVMVGIREFYETGGEIRPGKKGISLTMDQWNSLKSQMDDIEEAIKEF